MTVRLKVMVVAGMLAFGWAALAQQPAPGTGSSVTVEVPAQNAGKNPDKNSSAKVKGKKGKSADAAPDAATAPDAGVKAVPVGKTAAATPVTKQSQGAGKSVAGGAAAPTTAAMASSVTVEVGPANSTKVKGKKTKPGAAAVQDAAAQTQAGTAAPVGTVSQAQGAKLPAAGSAAGSSAAASGAALAGPTNVAGSANTAATQQAGRVAGKAQAAGGKGAAAGDGAVQTVTVEVPPQTNKGKGKKSKAAAGAPASAPGADELAKTPPSNTAGDVAATTAANDSPAVGGASGSSAKAGAAKADMVETEAVEVAAKNQPPPKKVAAGKKPKAGSKKGAAPDAAPEDAVVVEATAHKVPAAGEVATGTAASAETVEIAEAGKAPVSARERAAAEKAAAKKVVVEEPVEVPPQAVLDAQGKPVMNSLGDPLYSPGMIQKRDASGKLMVNENGDPVMQVMSPKLNAERVERVKKEGAPRAMPLIITDGALLVDGLPGKVRLNYDITQLAFLYLFVPGTGTVVVSNMPFPGGIREPRAFDGKKLTVKASGHVLTVESEVKMTAGRPLPAFVSVDHNFALRSRFPVMGYGATRTAPYAWPGSKAPATTVATGSAPTVSKYLLPSTEDGQACPAGQVCPGAPGTVATAEAKPADGAVAADAKPADLPADSEAKPVAATDEAPAAVEAAPVAPVEAKPEEKPETPAPNPPAPSF